MPQLASGFMDVLVKNRPFVLLDRIASTTYVDAVYCYRTSSVVCWSVTLASSAKTAEPIEMLRVGPGNHVLDWGPDPPWEGAILRGRGRGGQL